MTLTEQFADASTDNAGPSTALASATDFDCFTSCTTGLAALPARSGNRQGCKNTGPQLLLHRLQTSTARLAHRRTMLDPRLLLPRLRTSTASHHTRRGWQPCPLRSGIRSGGKSTGPQLLLHRLRTSTARLAHRQTMLDPRLLLHRLRTSSATDFDCSLGSSTDNAGPSTALA